MILLTGATGYLGSHLLKAFENQNKEVLILKRSASNTSRIENLIRKIPFENIDEVEIGDLFKKYPITQIVHCATCYGRHGESPLEILNTNVSFPLELAHFGAAHGLKAFYNTSTSLPEDLNIYAMSKKHLESWLFKYSDKFKIINIKPEYFYGPGDDPSKFITMLISKMKNDAGKIPLSTGEQKRDFFYIDDLVNAYQKLIANESQLEPLSSFEIGSGQNISLKALVLKIARELEYDPTNLGFGAIPTRPNEIMESKADLTAIKKMGWSPEISLDEGLIRTIKIEL